MRDKDQKQDTNAKQTMCVNFIGTTILLLPARTVRATFSSRTSHACLVHERHDARARAWHCARERDADASFLTIPLDTSLRVCRCHVGRRVSRVVLARLALLLEGLDPEFHFVFPHARGHSRVEPRIWLLHQRRVVWFRPNVFDLRDPPLGPYVHPAEARGNKIWMEVAKA